MAYLDRLFHNIPCKGGNWKFIPLADLPVKTKLKITFNPPTSGVRDDFVFNGELERHLHLLPAGEYEMEVGKWPTVYFLRFRRRKKIPVKPHYSNLAPRSIFSANFIENRNNLILTTGLIQSIFVVGTPYQATVQNLTSRERTAGAMRVLISEWSELSDAEVQSRMDDQRRKNGYNRR